MLTTPKWSPLQPDEAGAYAARGYVHRELGDHQAAFNGFNQALKLNADHGEAYIGRGLARYKLGEKKEGISDLKQALRILNQEGKTATAARVREALQKLSP